MTTQLSHGIGDVGAAASRVGETLHDKWHLDELLGAGGMAAVYAATHRNGMRGAVKILHPQLAADPEARRRFLREGYIANHVEHKGVVRVLDDDVTDGGDIFLVMELLDGTALHERASASGGRLDPAEVLLVADRLLDVLEAAHERGVVHRDVKPENIFVTRTGAVKLLDFGIARLAEPPPSMKLVRTQAGAPMGTPAFMSPEQARGRWDLVGPRSDVWSVGAMMFSLLTGELVHQEETVQELLAAAFMKPARSLRSAMPDASDELVAIVDRALAHSAEDRWQSAREMQEAIRASYQSVAGAPRPSTIPPGAAPVDALELHKSPTLKSAKAISTFVQRRLRELSRGKHRLVAGVAVSMVLGALATLLTTSAEADASARTVTTFESTPRSSVVHVASSASRDAADLLAMPASEPPKEPAIKVAAAASRVPTKAVRPSKSIFDRRY